MTTKVLRSRAFVKLARLAARDSSNRLRFESRKSSTFYRVTIQDTIHTQKQAAE
jgi:hypothetical protein